MTDPTLEREILVAGLDDWLSFAEVTRYVSVALGAAVDNDAFEATMGVITELLANLLIEVGEMGGQPLRFVPWMESKEAILTKIRDRYAETVPFTGIRPGDVCWISLTAKGRERVV